MTMASSNPFDDDTKVFMKVLGVKVKGKFEVCCGVFVHSAARGFHKFPCSVSFVHFVGFELMK